jgi:hypothetical protein
MAKPTRIFLFLSVRIMKHIFILALMIAFTNLAFGQGIVLPVDEVKKSGKESFVKRRKNVERSDWSKYYRYPKAVKKLKYNVAVFTPMFLDSVDLQKNLTRIPKFMRPGLDFYQGVEIAADTLRKKGFHFDFHVFDSRSKYLNIQNVIQSDRLDSMDLIIGNASVRDLKALADYARVKEINFVSAVSPSSAKQEFNPFFTILQPTLQTHVRDLHRVIAKKYPEDNVIYLYGDKRSEKNALRYFEEDELYSTPGRFKKVKVTGGALKLDQIKSLLDSNYHTTIVLGTLSPKTSYKILKSLVPLAKETRLKVFGMPTLEMITSLKKTEAFPNMKIYFTTAFVKETKSPKTKYILSKYRKRMGGTPTDVLYKGFESIYFFAHMMDQYGVPFNEHITSNRFSFLTPYKIMPVKNKGKFKYFENKYLYMLSYKNGIMTYE